MEEPGSVSSPLGQKSRIILYLVILTIFYAFAISVSETDQLYVTLGKWNYGHFLMTYAAEAACGPEKEGRYTHHNQTTAPHQERAADYDITCRPDEYTVWEEWRNCITQYLVETRWTEENEGGASPCNVSRNLPAVNTVFEEFVLHQSHLLPWSSPSNLTVVLLEFRALDRQMTFTVKNAMDNLPVHWPIQVVGGPSTCAMVTRLFPVETAAGKIILTDLGINAQTQVQDQISKLYTDINFYEKLLGDTWLFIQHDSVICKQQRHLMKGFIAKDRGWWGAPWSFWNREPAMCGNGGFSLRKRGFIEFILKRFSWDGALPEDLWFCYKSIDIYHELPDEFKPANISDERSFASETIPSESPFGLHKFWPWLQPHAPEVRTSLESCPEALGIFPPELLDSDSGWHDLICALDVAWESFDQRTNITFDYKAHCGPILSTLSN